MDYSAKITQSVEELQQLEKQQTKPLNRDYVRFIRLLKSKQATTQKQAAELVNLQLRQGQRIFKKYLDQGIEALIKPRQSPYMGKMSFTQIGQLQRFAQDDHAAQLADIQDYLSQNQGINYTISGISKLCKRLKIKKKTGRPVHIHQQPGAIEDFKKKCPS
jgi:transposase